MSDGLDLLLNHLRSLFELREVNVKLRVVEVPLLDWLSNLLEFLYFLSVLFLWCALTVSVNPIHNLVNLLKEFLLGGFIEILFPCSIRIEVVPHLIRIGLKVVSQLFHLEDVVVAVHELVLFFVERLPLVWVKGERLSIEKNI